MPRLGHNIPVHGQAPGQVSTAAPQAAGFVDAVQHLGWVDITALSVLLVFFLLGLFKGIFWQVSRVVILAAAYGVAAQVGHPLGDVLLRWTHAGPEPATEDQQLTAFYIGCVLVFVGVLIVLSLLSLLVQSLVKRAGLGFYDRLFGGIAGVGSGAIVVLFLLTFVYMFFPGSRVASAANASHSLRLSQQAVAMLGGMVPQELRSVFPNQQPAGAGQSGAPQPGAGHGQSPRSDGAAGALPADATAPRKDALAPSGGGEHGTAPAAANGQQQPAKGQPASQQPKQATPQQPGAPKPAAQQPAPQKPGGTGGNAKPADGGARRGG